MINCNSEAHICHRQRQIAVLNATADQASVATNRRPYPRAVWLNRTLFVASLLSPCPPSLKGSSRERPLEAGAACTLLLRLDVASVLSLKLFRQVDVDGDAMLPFASDLSFVLGP